MTHLPTFLAAIADVAGEENARTVAAQHGASEVHIPLAVQPDHWLSQLIGHPEATSVAAAMACQIGLRIKVPYSPSPAAAETLPPSFGSATLDNIASVIGVDATFALAVEFMGERVYVPHDPDNQPRFAAAIGEEAAAQFCDVFWRTHVVFPSNLIKHRLILSLDAEGVTKREIARRVKKSERAVYDVLRRYRKTEQGEIPPEEASI